MPTLTLPSPSGPSQPYWDISVIDSAHLHCPLALFIDPLPAPTPTNPNPEHRPSIPVLSFLLRHSHFPNSRPTLFDASIAPSMLEPNADNSPIPPYVRNVVVPIFSPFRVSMSVPEVLARGGVQTDDIEHVILSHLHWDHVGDPSWFKRANFIVGEGGKTLLENGYPYQENSQFKANLLPAERITFRSDPENWPSLGPFPHALDYFGDGSLYIVDSPGHLPGHINALVRIAPTPVAPNNWVYLAGDAAQHCHLITGEANMVVKRDPETGKVLQCWHEDPDLAQASIDRIKELMSLNGVDGIGVKVMLAHDGEWYEKNKGGSMFWPGKL